MVLRPRTRNHQTALPCRPRVAVGYSGKPLAAKLGLREGDRALAVGAPEGYERLLGPIAAAVVWRSSARGELDFVHLFVTGRAELAKRFPAVSRPVREGGMVWVSWPKKASGVPTDLTEPIWRTALELARPEVRGIRVRLLGVTASSLGVREQLGLFDDTPDGASARRRKATEATDRIRRRYGDRAVTRARLLGADLPAPFERDPMKPLERRTGMPGSIGGEESEEGDGR